MGPTGIGSSAVWIPAYRRRVPEENRDLSVPLVPRERREIQESRAYRASRARRGHKARRGPKVTPETPARRVPQVRMASVSPP